MTQTTRYSLLAVVVIAVLGSIWYLEKGKIVPSGTSVDSTINLDALDASTSSDAAASSADSTGSSTSTSSTQAAASPSDARVRTADFAALQKEYPAAKELVSPDGYINTGGQSITIASLIGRKVVLLDFWTYSCINCQRTIPYLNAWYAKYKDYGLQIIGVHTPEFEFEKDIVNVQAAVQKFGIKYPVVLDSENQTWNSYGNQYWPEEYLVNIDGLITDKNIGEGNYDKTEHAIQEALQARAVAMGEPASSIPTGLVNVTSTINANSPETYFGSNRDEYLSNGAILKAGAQTLSTPDLSSVAENQLYLGGTWNFMPEYAQSQSADATITYKYDAQHVYFVAAAPAGVSVTVTRDGVPVGSFHGADVDAQGNATIKQSRLYDLISEPQAGTHTLQITVHGAGLQAYTFTFG